MNKYFFAMIIGALTIGLSPILTKSVSINPSAISFYRFLFGTIGLTIFTIFKRQSILKSELINALPYGILGGGLFAVDLWFWHRSIIYIGAGISTLLANTQIFYLILIGIIFLRERPSKKFYFSCALTFVGLYFSSKHLLDVKGNENITPGIIFGLLTGVTYSLVTLTLKKSSQQFKSPGAYPIFLITFFACIFSLLICLFTNEPLTISNTDLGFMAVYGSLVHVTGWLLITFALQKIPVSIAGLILLLQPTNATILGILIFKEHASLVQFLGLILSLIGIYLASIS